MGTKLAKLEDLLQLVRLMPNRRTVKTATQPNHTKITVDREPLHTFVHVAVKLSISQLVSSLALGDD